MEGLGFRLIAFLAVTGVHGMERRGRQTLARAHGHATHSVAYLSAERSRNTEREERKDKERRV